MKLFCRYATVIVFFIVPFYFVACIEDDSVPEPTRLTLESSTRIFSRSKSEIEGFIDIYNNEELNKVKAYLKYGVTYYEVEYRTEYLGKEIIASGLVTFPDTPDIMPMLSFQNGTIVDNEDAPTNSSELSFLTSIASAGYIFVMPDYIGFGSSADEISPYHQKDYAASAVIDLLIAARQLAEQEGYGFDNNVFLGGYSEGGYATMAAHINMEQEFIPGLHLVASAPAAGGYDVKAFQEYFFSLDTYDNPFYMAYVALSYKTVYGYDTPLSDLFQEPYASRIPDLFDGTKSGSEINDQLTTTVADLLQPDVLANLDTDSKYNDFVSALNDNNLTYWVPMVPIYMYHGDADVTVPYQNSVSTYEKLLELGASPSLVTLTPIEGATHGSGFFPYLIHMIEKFETLK